MSTQDTEYDRVELVWPGKTTEVERVSLPFQTIERVNDVSRSIGQQGRLRDGSELPDWWPAGWRNKLIWGENKYVLSSLLDEFAGKVDLIYIDPPFATGDDFTSPVIIGSEDEVEVTKEATILEQTAYRDTWRSGVGSYVDMMFSRLRLMYELMSSDSSIWVHMDEHAGHYVRVMLDEIFGYDCFVNEIVWHYPDNFQGNVNRYANNHNVIYVYRKGMQDGIERQRTDRSKPVRINRRSWSAESGRLVSDRDEEGNIIYDTYDEKWLDDVWTIGQKSVVQRRSKEYLPYPTQKPEEILQNIILSASRKGSLVADLFCGSGTALAVAEKLGRRWVGTDLSRFAIHTTRKRLLDVPDCKPFEVLNLGRYERRYWQGVNAGEAIWQYYRFILDLYGAQQISGFAHLHGEKAGRMVHVGATDAPITRDELAATLAECAANGITAVDVLGWEWEMGLNPAGKDELAREHGVDVYLRNIPREVMDERAVEAGDIHFFELSVADVHAHQSDAGLVLELANFLPAVDEYMQQKVQGQVGKWSDWIDYWSVDFDYDGETFVNRWQAYRTRREPSLMLRSDPFQYDNPGSKRIVVKVIDIFGNDTTVDLEVEVT